jgi:hypothetical protein
LLDPSPALGRPRELREAQVAKASSLLLVERVRSCVGRPRGSDLMLAREQLELLPREASPAVRRAWLRCRSATRAPARAAVPSTRRPRKSAQLAALCDLLRPPPETRPPRCVLSSRSHVRIVPGASALCRQNAWKAEHTPGCIWRPLKVSSDHPRPTRPCGNLAGNPGLPCSRRHREGPLRFLPCSRPSEPFESATDLRACLYVDAS